MAQLSPRQAVDLGWQLHQQGRWAEAERLYREVLAIDPNQADALQFLGVLASQTGNPAVAIKLITRAIEIDGTNSHYHSNLGQVLVDSGQFDAAIPAFDRALELKPWFTPAMVNRGIALLRRNRFDEAIQSFDRALALDPSLGSAHNNRAVALHATGRLDEAIAGYQNAIRCRDDDSDAHLNLGLTLLLQGNLEIGWKEFEWRWCAPHRLAMIDRLNKPAWRGEPIKGKSLLIHADEGFGDTIQFIRYLPLVAQRSEARIILHCQAELVSLLKQVRDVELIVDVVREGDFEFDYFRPLLSLPGLFGASLTTIPREPTPYLRASPERSEWWKQRFEPAGQKLKIGLVWAGRAEHANDHNRSMPPAALTHLAQVPGINFVSLQKGATDDQLHCIKSSGIELSNWTAELKDFSETAALIENLDLVITVDTAVAHLAGAMGKRVFLMLAFVPDWRWLLDRSDSPWYPSMTLFRQPRIGNWNTPMKQVAELLRQENH